MGLRDPDICGGNLKRFKVLSSTLSARILSLHSRAVESGRVGGGDYLMRGWVPRTEPLRGG